MTRATATANRLMPGGTEILLLTRGVGSGAVLLRRILLRTPGRADRGARRGGGIDGSVERRLGRAGIHRHRRRGIDRPLCGEGLGGICRGGAGRRGVGGGGGCAGGGARGGVLV